MPQGESINAEYIIIQSLNKVTSKRFQNPKKDKISLKEMHFQMDNRQVKGLAEVHKLRLCISDSG